MNILHIVSIVCFAFCLLIFFYLKWYVKKRTSPSGMLDEYRIEVGKLIAEIDKAADRDSQLVEDRIKQLKNIIEETDKRISVYVKELEKSKTPAKLPAEALYTSLGRGIRAALSETQDVNNQAPQLSSVRPDIAPVSAKVAQSASVKSAVLQPAVVQPAVVQPAVVQPKADLPEPVRKPPSKKQIRAHIDLLLNEGMPPEEIASRLEISVAEVNLAVNLRRAKKN